MKRTYPNAIMVLLLLAMLVSGCAKAGVSEESLAMDSAGVSNSQSVVARTYAEAEKAAVAEAPAALGTGSATSASGDLMDRMIIRTVNMSVVVEDTDVMLDKIQQMVDAYGGYVSESNRWLNGEQPYASVTLRVPAEKLEEALGILRDASITVESESSSGDDVTEQYVDISARLRNLEATEQELLALLTEVRKNRGSADDILAIHNRLTDIRAQIESLKGQQQYLERSAALATVYLSIRPKALPGVIVQPEKWNPLVTVTDALRAFVELLQILADVLIWLLILSPVVLVPVLIIWLIVRAFKRHRAKKAKAQQE